MKDDVSYVGPFQETRVVVNGRQVPFLTASHMGPSVSLTLDHRFGLDLPVELAENVTAFIANCIAVAMGFACHPSGDAEPVPNPVFPRLMEITSVETSDVGNTADSETEE